MPTAVVPLYRLLENVAHACGERPALAYRGVSLTFEQVGEQMNRFASSLQQALAVDPGQCIALHLPNCPQFLIAAHAAWKLGAAIVPLAPSAEAAQIVQQTTAAGAQVIVTLSPLVTTVLAAQPQTPLRHVIVAFVKDYLPFGARLRYALFREKKEGQAFDFRTASRFVYPYTNMVLHNPRPDPVEVEPADPAAFFGGTGRAYTHGDLLAAIGPVSLAAVPTTFAATAPFWELPGLVAALVALYSGHTLLLPP